MSAYNQTLWVVWGNHILAILALVFFFEWWMIPALFILGHLFGIINELSIHRYFSHGSYKVNARWKEHVLKAMAFLVGQGAIMSWTTVHRHHHAYEDQPGDPHSPYYHPLWKIYVGLFPTEYKKNMVVDFLRHRDKNYFIFENKYYWLMWTALWIVSYLISPYLFFAIVGGSAVWYAYTALIVNIISHMGTFGYKTYPDTVSSNSKLANWIAGPLAGLHNNHRKNSRSYTYNLDGDTNMDFVGWIIEKIKS